MPTIGCVIKVNNFIHKRLTLTAKSHGSSICVSKIMYASVACMKMADLLVYIL